VTFDDEDKTKLHAVHWLGFITTILTICNTILLIGLVTSP
jgi:hypothetical protein